MSKTIIAFLVFTGIVCFGIACGPKPVPGRPAPVERPCWNNAKAEEAVNKLAEEYRKAPDDFMKNRTYAWAGTWLWPETVGIGEKNLDALKQMYYKGDDAVKEVILNVVLMNVPAGKLQGKESNFMRDLVIFDADLKERRANVPPPSDAEEIIIEEYVQPPPK